MKNIVLTGIMGCGKTTLGKAVAERLNMQFIDMDQYIEQKEGKTVSEIFDLYGENGFRNIESAVCADISGKSGLVIATGGGVILRSENIEALKSTGINIFINRPVEMILQDIDSSDRPLIKSNPERLWKIYETRKNLYFSAADIIFDNTGSAEEAADAMYNMIAKLKSPRLAVVGDPIAHSLSPDIHIPVLKRFCDCPEYGRVQVLKGELSQWLVTAKNEGYDGFNLTMPHKIDVLPMLDDVDPEAELTGSVNTVVNRNRKLYGYTTDGAGFFIALTEMGIDIKNKNVVILGAGGAARSIAFKVALEGAGSIIILARRPEQARKLKELVHAGVPGVNLLSDRMTTASVSKFSEQADILVNATPCGMEGVSDKWESFEFVSKLRGGACVCDLIYKPEQTELLMTAQSLGYTTMNGLEMLIYQALIADEYYLGIKINKKAAAETARRELRGK